MRILVVEDDAVLRDGIVRALMISKYVVDSTGTCAEAARLVSASVYDVVVLDLGLPDGDGSAVLARARDASPTTAVLVVSARAEVEARVRMLDAGADDYLVKPFALSELEARVRLLVRRSTTDRRALRPLGRLLVDLAQQRVTCEGASLALTDRDWELLSWFACHPGEVVSTERLATMVSTTAESVSANALEVAIHRLRRRVEPHGVHLRHIRGLGYRVIATDAATTEAATAEARGRAER